MSEKTDESTNFKFSARLGGSLYQLAMVPQFAGVSQNEAKAEPLGKPGQYRVVITLGRPGFSALPEGQFTFTEQNKGDSHLAIAPPALLLNNAHVTNSKQVHVRSNQTEFVVDLSPNEKGFLGRLIAQSVGAYNAPDAVSKVTEAIAPFLSVLSAHFDIPLKIEQTEAVELRTQIRTILFVTAHNYAPFNPPNPPALSDEFLLYVSYYREALGSNTPAYQFLCFYKIMEAIRKRRERISRETVALGLPFTAKPKEVIPQDQQEFAPWLNMLFPEKPEWDDLDFGTIFLPEARGKKFNKVFDDYLTPLRNGIAHSVLDNEELVISADKMANSQKLLQWLPLTKCMVRQLLKNTFPQEFLP